LWELRAGAGRLFYFIYRTAHYFAAWISEKEPTSAQARD
jgi:hypothetical protein